MSDNEIRFTADADGRVTEALRAIHAPPADASYWNSLESRVMDRLATAERNGWWQVAAQWARPGLAAAAALLLIAGSAALGERNDAEQVAAYEAFAPAAEDETLAVYAEADATTQQESTLRLVVAH